MGWQEEGQVCRRASRQVDRRPKDRYAGKEKGR